VGLAEGDEILAIDGASVARMTLKGAVPVLRGPEGTAVTVTIVKAGDAARRPLTVTVPRRIVRGRG
jgi:C-terminal processing protease CtpA/Prc